MSPPNVLSGNGATCTWPRSARLWPHPKAIVGLCGDCVVVAIGPAVGTFVFEIPREAVPVALPPGLPLLPENPVHKIVSVDRLNVPDQWLVFGVPAEMDEWTETIVVGDDFTLACKVRHGGAIFTRTGHPVQVLLAGPGARAVANFNGDEPGSNLSKEVGLTYLLNDPLWQGFSELLAIGAAVAPGVDVRSDAAQFALAWPRFPKLRHVGWALHLHGETGLRWPGDRGFAREAGVSRETVNRYIDRAFAVGLPVPSGLFDKWLFPWTLARRVCYRQLVQAGHLAGWLRLIERVEELGASIEDPVKRERFVKVAQAVVSLRLRGAGEGRPSVRAELEAEGAGLKCSDAKLDEIIALVQNELREK